MEAPPQLIEHRQRNFSDLFERSPVGLEPRQRAHPLDCGDEKSRQCLRILLGRQLTFGLRTPQRPSEDRFDFGLIVAQEFGDDRIFGGALHIRAQQQTAARMLRPSLGAQAKQQPRKTIFDIRDRLEHASHRSIRFTPVVR